MSAIMTSRQAAELDHAFERNGWTADDVKWLSERDTLAQVLNIRQGTHVIKLYEPAVLKIDRSKPFDPAKFFGNASLEIYGQDACSLAITELDLAKVELTDALNPGEAIVNGFDRQSRLKRTLYHTILDAKIFQTLWENKHLIPPSWKNMADGRVRTIYFNGTIVHNSCDHFVLGLYWDGIEWQNRTRAIDHNNWDKYSLSAVLSAHK